MTDKPKRKIARAAALGAPYDTPGELTAEDLLALLAGGMLAGPRIINLPYWVYVDGSDLTIRYTPINPEDYWNDT